MKIAIVTGGSSGIGFEICSKLLQEGIYVYNLDIIKSPEKNRSTYDWLECDVSSERHVKNAVKKIISQHKKIDYLVLNAGIYLNASLEETDSDLMHNLFAVNVFGAVYLLKQTLPQMRKSRNGSIVIVASDQALVAKPRSVAYGMTKAALYQLNKSVAKENATWKIRCNVVCPGATRTPLYEDAVKVSAKKHKVARSEYEKKIGESYPLGRIAEPNEIADGVFFLLSDKAKFVTGAELRIDGGLTL